LKSTAAFQKFTLGKIAAALTPSLRLGTNPQAAALLEPLVADVVSAESLGSFGGARTNGPGFIVAARLDARRAQQWRENLDQALGAKGEHFVSEGFEGWQWNSSAADSLWIVAAEDWLLAGRGGDFLPLRGEYLRQLKAGKGPAPPQQSWLEADMDTSLLAGWVPVCGLLKAARIHLTVRPHEENLRIAARVVYAEPVPWKAESWRIPKTLIRDPLISFTAGRDVAAFLNLEGVYSHVAGSPLTNQCYFWAQNQMPLLDYMAWPEENATNALEKLAAEAPAALNPKLKPFNGTELAWEPERGRLVWRNMRMLVPVLEAAQDEQGQYLLLACFPRMTRASPAPAALWDQVQGRDNLVYYDWEVTGLRLQEWRILHGMLANRAAKQGADAAETMSIEAGWLGGLGSVEGNTVTEITRVAPSELSVVRNAPVGLTGVEWVMFSDWLCEAYAGPIHAPFPGGSAPPQPARR
jgi:hypothetical protein